MFPSVSRHPHSLQPPSFLSGLLLSFLPLSLLHSNLIRTCTCPLSRHNHRYARHIIWISWPHIKWIHNNLTAKPASYASRVTPYILKTDYWRLFGMRDLWGGIWVNKLCNTVGSIERWHCTIRHAFSCPLSIFLFSQFVCLWLSF